MPQPVKLSDPMVDAARAAAEAADRSIAGQVEHWARLGRATERALAFDDLQRVKQADGLHRPAPPRLDDSLVSALRRAVAQPGVAEGAAHYVASGSSTAHGIDDPPWPQWLESRREAIQALCRLARVRRLAFFGSVLEARFDPARGSDIDATVEFVPTPLPSARQYFDFRTALSHILGTPVDLVELAAMPETRLKRIIERTQRVFHVDPG